MGFELTTKRGYDFFEVSSAMQKAIRRANVKMAGYFAIELWESGYRDYVWKRLLTVSAEDCAGIITKEVFALYKSHQLVNKPKHKTPKGRVFVVKAVILLCQQMKSRDADHLTNFVYDKKKSLSDEAINECLRNADVSEKKEIPEYAYDYHTRQGKLVGKTKKDFFIEEFAALKPRQPGLFDHLVEQ